MLESIHDLQESNQSQKEDFEFVSSDDTLPKRMIPLGYTIDTDKPEVIWLDFTQPGRKIIIISMTGGGKTVMVRRIVDYLDKNNIMCIFPNDRHNEMRHSSKPNVNYNKMLAFTLSNLSGEEVSEKTADGFRRELVPFDHPRAIDRIKVFTPSFCKTSDATKFTLKINDLHVREFARFLFSFKTQDRHKVKAVRTFYKYVVDTRAKKGRNYPYIRIIKEIESNAEDIVMKMHGRIVGFNQVVSDLQDLIEEFDFTYNEDEYFEGNSDITIPEMPFSVKDMDFKWNHVVVEWSKAPTIMFDEAKSVYDIYTGKILSKFLEDKRAGLFPITDYTTITDEAQDFVIKSRNSLTKRSLMTEFKESRKYGGNSILSFQSPYNVEPQLVDNADYIILTRTNTRESMGWITSSFDDYFRNKSNVNAFYGLEKNQFVLIDNLGNNQDRFTPFVSFPSLSYHPLKVQS